ncbi:two-component regulator propeller domain-containing protein [Mucilaginibacter sp. CSA2-8R]|uniref:hybrid sensor histidine kinase/response regulator transcription factor n=1 Tax=Mucilaginibacter sp. CSA2-8R TaxID=3141542 RepID=UPI00315DB9A5
MNSLPLKGFKEYLLFLFGFLCAAAGYASPVPVKYLGIENGLSNNSATCIAQDKYGFIWIGTYDGLNRYDGYEFKTFKNIWGNAKSLVNNHTKAVRAVGNRIYAGTEKGMCYFDYTDSEFHSLYYLDENKRRIKVNFDINEILSDAKGNVYAATSQTALLKFSPHDTVGVAINVGLGNTVQCMTFDRTNRLCVFINGVGLGCYDAAKNKITIINREVITAGCLAADVHNNIWIGSANGLYIYNRISKKVGLFENSKRKLVAGNISNLLLTANGSMWISTNGSGINIWNEQSQSLSAILPGESRYDLKSGAVSVVFEDNESRKWIATLRGGINVIDKNINLFRLYNHDAFNKNSVPNNFIRSFCEDELHNVWIGTDGRGISYWNTKNNTYQTYDHHPAAGSISSNFVVSVIKDYTNKIWVASFNGGIDAFDKSAHGFRHYPCFELGTKVEERNIWKLYEDAKHRLWAGSTWGGALYLYNRKLDSFEIFDKRLVDIHTLFEDDKGELWGGNYTHLINIDTKQKKHRYYFIGQAIRAIAQDSLHQLWIGTEGGGLLKFNRQTHQFIRYTENEGLPSNTVLNILIDNKNNLWCSTYNGLSKFVQAKRSFINYFASDGLQSNQFMYNAALRLQSGQMLFGGIKGFNLFNPDSVSAYVHQPRVQLTDFKVSNVPLNRTGYADQQSLNTVKHIKIPFNQATISISFTALEYSYPEKISYAYYLEGWDHEWNYVGKSTSAYFSRLTEGDYSLKIKATNTEGTWSSEPLVIKITVLPPWYRTWWAYLGYLTVFGLSAYAFGYYRKRQLKLTYEVEIANLRVEREKELNEKKLAFFTNVSHEFRTPLTLIINPIKDLLNQNKSNADELNVIYRNARRLLGMVDHLLLFRKTETENTQLKASRVDFVTLCNDVFVCFAQQAKIRKISYTLDFKAESVEIYADREKIEIALFNLISNAIKFTPDGGSIVITLDEDDGNVFFTIADNGIGISKDVGDKLFNKFYQAKDSNYFKTGFGIGLYLVKVFIEAHHGSINYCNNPNGGTTFTLSIPKGKKHFTLEEVCENVIFDANPITELIDYNNREAVVQEAETVNLELLLSNKLSILIIDDNEQIRDYIKKVFNQDYNVLEACSGKQGLEIIKKYLPDMVISDIVMGEMSGLELCKAIKQDTSINHIPVILLTGDATSGIMIKSIEEGAVDFLSKPFEKEILIAKVKSILRSRAELQNYFYKEITLKNNVRNISEEHKDFLYNCISVIEQHLIDHNFDVEMLSKKVGMSYPTLFKRIKLITGQSVNNFIRFVRLRKAAELLIHTNCNVNEAAYQAGFNDIKYFREHFNKQFGVNPSEFIKKHRATFQISYRMNQSN